jgi:hypothetical protein
MLEKVEYVVKAVKVV